MKDFKNLTISVSLHLIQFECIFLNPTSKLKDEGVKYNSLLYIEVVVISTPKMLGKYFTTRCFNL